MKKLLYVLLIFTGFYAKAQQTADNNVKSIVDDLDNYRNKVPVEKVHLHFDKPYYSVGDTIWFKSYVVNERNELSSLSSVLYIDLVNDQNAVKKSLRIPLFQGLGWGNIALKDSLFQRGNYHIHAYTNWMRNFSTSYFFNKPIKIVNAMAVQNDNNAPVNQSADGSVQFFPEGGELVNDISSKIAFKAVGTDGLSREITGYIVDKNNSRITTFQSEHAGMGTFIFTPVLGNNYTAVVKFRGGNESRVSLPKALQRGYTLSVTQNKDDIAVKVNASAGLLGSGKILLIAQANSIVQYAGQKPLISTSLNTIIPKTRFPEGVLQLTLFSPDDQPVAERLVFIRHEDEHLKISIVPDKSSYKPREKVHLNIQVTDKTGTPVVGSFSLAINDESKVPFDENDETTIFSNLLLTSELKGYIEQPGYYFTSNNPSDNNTDKEHQLDNLLLTQGWRRFVWKDVLNNTLPALTYKAEAGINIGGKVVDNRGKPVPGARVSVIISTGMAALLDTVTNNEGAFSFNNVVMKKGVTFDVLATDAKRKKNFTVEIDKQTPDPVVFDEVPVNPFLNNNFNTYAKNEHDRLYELNSYGLLDNSIALKEVTVKEAALKHSMSLAAHGEADQTLTFMDLLGCQQDLMQCLAGRLNNVRIGRDSLGNFVPFSRGFGHFGQASTGPPVEVKAVFIMDPMLVVVDGVQGRSINDVPASDVASIEVLRGGGAASLYGMRGENGVIIITTKKGDVDYNAFEDQRYHNDSGIKKAFSSYNFQEGYDLRREFYSPDYDNPATNKQMADLRTTVYWAPNIMTNESGKASVDFFNADGTGNYRVITEGLDLQGRLARNEYRYTVK